MLISLPILTLFVLGFERALFNMSVFPLDILAGVNINLYKTGGCGISTLSLAPCFFNIALRYLPMPPSGEILRGCRESMRSYAGGSFFRVNRLFSNYGGDWH
jgi:hypothetical protein